MAKFHYMIDLDERGEFSADVRDESGKTVFELHSDDEGIVWPIEDGFMRDKRDLSGLAAMLCDWGIMESTDTLVMGDNA